MAKQGMHKHDDNDENVSRGHNNPAKSVTITTGTPKKRETYEAEARAHEDTGKPAQAAKNEWIEDTRETSSRKADSQAMQADRTERTGSHSNEH